VRAGGRARTFGANLLEVRVLLLVADALLLLVVDIDLLVILYVHLLIVLLLRGRHRKASECEREAREHGSEPKPRCGISPAKRWAIT
jgi:hypothetical protein